MEAGQTVTIRSGYGYWDLTYYPWGGSFKRADGDTTATVLEVLDRYTNGKPRRLVLQTETGKRKVGVSTDALTDK